MKPVLGKDVYCIYHDVGIMVDTVGYIGEDSFIVSSFNNSTEEDSWEWDYKDYNDKWFTDLSKAKEKLLSIGREKHDCEMNIVQKCYDWYELEFPEEA